MKLKSVTLENFRCFEEATTITFNNLTAFIGKNDIGKSTILEALEIFFNNSAVKFDLSDFNINHKDEPVVIICDFDDIPEEVVLDEDAKTDFDAEYLTIQPGILRIRKEFPPNKIAPQVFVIANHPKSAEIENPLILLKEKELQTLVKKMSLNCSLKGNPGMRQAIWAALSDKKLEVTKIDVTKRSAGDLKGIWEQIEKFLPIFEYFRSDRGSSDSDSEIQDPMKAAALMAVSEMAPDIKNIQSRIETRALEIAEETKKTLKEINPGLAEELRPRLASPTTTKWAGLFPISLDTENGIPLNKRGNGVRRLVLVAFFKTEAEKRIREKTEGNVIYAIEEPENAQHPDNQRILLRALSRIAESKNAQVILTTHSPALASDLPWESLRFIHNQGRRKVDCGEAILPDIIKELGVLPDLGEKVRVIVCVEGPTDVAAITALGKCIHENNPSVVDVEGDSRVLLISLGGSTLEAWVNRDYLRKLRLPEVHIYDSDVNRYEKSVRNVNARANGSWATQTKKYEIENYLHPQVIRDLYGVNVDTNQEKFPEAFAEKLQESNPTQYKKRPNSNTAKRLLSSAFEKMTWDYLKETDPEGEVLRWFEKITELANGQREGGDK